MIAINDLINLHQRYVQVLDSNDFSAWPDLFTEDAVYKIQSRENFDAGLPLCTLSFESRGMLIDRVYGAAKTIYHDPYHQCHIVGMPLITRQDDAGLESETNYLVVRTKRDAMPDILSVGRYIDRVVQVDGKLLFAQRLCVFDNDLIANSVIKPI